MDRLHSARVAVFGIGGVGGYTVEALARSGLRVTRKRERNGWAALEAVLA